MTTQTDSATWSALSTLASTLSQHNHTSNESVEQTATAGSDVTFTDGIEATGNSTFVWSTLTNVVKATVPVDDNTPFYYEYSTAQFEVLLPCIFGVFVVLALSFIVFYSKHANQYEVLEKHTGGSDKQHSQPDQWESSNGVAEVNRAFTFGP